MTSASGGKQATEEEMITQFRMIDDDNSGQIDVIEFFRLIDVLHFRYSAPIRLYAGKLKFRQWTLRLYLHRHFGKGIQVLVVVYCFILLVALQLFSRGDTLPALEMCCLVILALFAV